jgi:hypothetical protein
MIPDYQRTGNDATGIPAAFKSAVSSWVLEGPPGWFWTSVITATVVAIWWAAAFWGLKSAEEFWEKGSGSVIGFMGIVFIPWLTYKGARAVMGTRPDVVAVQTTAAKAAIVAGVTPEPPAATVTT